MNSHVVNSPGCKYISELQPTDVLFGRGSGPNEHYGNIRFRNFVNERKVEYNSTSVRLTKTKLAKEIVEKVMSGDEAGRFVRKLEPQEALDLGFISDLNTTIISIYEIVDEAAAIDKAKQTLRQNKQVDSSYRPSVHEPSNLLQTYNAPFDYRVDAFTDRDEDDELDLVPSTSAAEVTAVDNNPLLFMPLHHQSANCISNQMVQEDESGNPKTSTFFQQQGMEARTLNEFIPMQSPQGLTSQQHQKSMFPPMYVTQKASVDDNDSRSNRCQPHGTRMQRQTFFQRAQKDASISNYKSDLILEQPNRRNSSNSYFQSMSINDIFPNNERPGGRRVPTVWHVNPSNTLNSRRNSGGGGNQELESIDNLIDSFKTISTDGMMSCNTEAFYRSEGGQSSDALRAVNNRFMNSSGVSTDTMGTIDIQALGSVADNMSCATFGSSAFSSNNDSSLNIGQFAQRFGSISEDVTSDSVYINGMMEQIRAELEQELSKPNKV